MNRFTIYKKYLKPWSQQLFWVIFFQIMTAIFTVVSIPLIIPLFQILFNRESVDTLADTNLPDWLIDVLVGFFASHDRSDALLWFCMIIVVVFLLKNIFRYLAQYAMIPVRHGFIRDMRLDLFRHYQTQDLSYFYQTKSGQILSTLSNDIQEVEWSVLKMIETLFKEPLIIIGSVIFMLMINVQLTVFVGILIVIITVVIGGLSKNLKQDSGEAQSHLAKIMNRLEENITAQKLIKVFNVSSHWEDRFAETNQEYFAVSNRVMRRKELGSPISEFLGVSIVVLLMWYAAHLVFDNALHPETFFGFIFAFFQVIEPSKAFANAYFSTKKGAAAMDRIQQVFDQKGEIQFPAIPNTNFDTFSSLRFCDVHFAYANDSERLVLKDFNLEIQRGEKIGIKGASGSGKTTIIDLILRLYEVNKGKILINNLALQSLSQSQLRSQFAIVQQHTTLFHASIADNITMGASLDLARMSQACAAAQLLDYIEQLPEQFETIIGTRGMQLSGGQRQRLSIARALYHDAPVIILDEATSSLDAETEARFIEICRHSLSDKTLIIIAHQSNILSLADRLVNVA